ncbi:O-antigen polysaccharide polymerase Wzy [Pasteurella atlantica]|uniref:O-antigen polysaccharide polymerase Wzy n=1 Tax=Pasteurellaceae TaxID=712 RepID=UPI00275C8B60|nr:O-antigen polysaccharide polymerase Wzy [Pasteurella atlantica]MDP8032884.1 O-antigen polysaccharide polymerase Wzy [Pasteurella atlantica]MDP8034959.1 O-antigen polysaccharide polymerase Wzy [Pasteurella atlantica]MDP8036771.1 O-antigen polysaccharide polymerase Wzy [Pasteurella atlantica]MDP8047256.1 O-antigen polysaccharide polymerase Wzy [Pasteurella atlantica]MDP8049234.1 O-antigen polysaccharide polymerase Wzy [Pasteurella atlantica]
MNYLVLFLYNISFFIVWSYSIVVGNLSIEQGEIFLTISFFVMLFYAFKNLQNYLFFFCMVGLFGLFNYSRFILDTFGLMPYDVSTATRFIGYIFPEETIKETLWTYSISIYALFLGFVLTKSILPISKQEKNYKDINFYRRFGLFLILIASPGVIFKLSLTIKNIIQYGYVGFYLNPHVGSGITRIIEFASYKIFILGIGFYLINKLTKKQFLFIVCVLMSVVSVNLILGQRAAFGTALVFIFWYWFYFIRVDKKISSKFILLIFLLAFVSMSLFQYINASRNHKKEFNIIPTRIVISQGMSGIILPYYIDYKDTIGNDTYPYLLAPIVDRADKGLGPTQEMLDKTNFLRTELTAAVSPKAFFNGEGMGGSYITDLYEFGKIGVFVGMFLLGWFIVVFEHYRYKPFVKLLSYLIVSTIAFVPRGELFGSFYEILMFIICWWFVKVLIKISNVHKLKESSI